MPLLDLDKITTGLSRTWAGLLWDWDRSLQAGNYPETTRYVYLLAAAQLARYLGEYMPDPEAGADDDDPVEVSRAHVESFQAWVIQTRSASTALNKHKGLQQFFKWLRDDEQEIARSPMERVRQPKTPQKLIPIIRSTSQRMNALASHSGRGRMCSTGVMHRWLPLSLSLCWRPLWSLLLAGSRVVVLVLIGHLLAG